ncbi:hypothetical protein BGX33_011862 [Mortierella sp. NVP41]|nr:hypothetical protein BGX33_011862 [Mortierella sp. NVP41]
MSSSAPSSPTLSETTTIDHNRTDHRPRVLIVGAGLAGLTLAILLQKADVPYEIFERGLETRTVGSAMYFGPNVGPLFTQLGIYEEFLNRSKPCEAINIYNENREWQFMFDYKLATEMIHKGKKVISMYQDEKSVLVNFADGSQYEGDILVGADGAYSVVRQSLFEIVDQEDKLPASDAEDLPYSCIALSGHSAPLDPQKFPSLKDEYCHYNNTLFNDKPYSWTTFTNKDNIICWSAFKYLDTQNSAAYSREQRSDWGESATEDMCKEVHDFPIPDGDGTLTLGDLIDSTPKEQMTKVMLEEKVFDTWYHGRTVLVGDACHKILPAGNQGALMAFHDVVALANWINILPPSTTVEELENVFKAYKEERLPLVQGAAAHGKSMSQVSATQ